MNSHIFKRDFDAELAAEKEHENAVSAPEVLYDADELAEAVAHARQEGLDLGRKEGRAQGIKETEETDASRQIKATEEIAITLKDLIQTQSGAISSIEDEMSGMLSDICAKLLPDILDGYGARIVEAEIRKISLRAMGSRWLEIHVPQALAKNIEARIGELCENIDKSVDVKIIGDDSLSDHSVTATWQAGKSEYDVNRLCQKIIDTISTQVKQ